MRYFHLSEFDSPDLEGSGANMNQTFLALLDECRHICQFPFLVTSGYRTKEHNEELIQRGIAASPNSSHLKGLAADIAVINSSERWKLITAAMSVGITRIGIGTGFVHLDWDWTKEQRKIWTYGYSN